MILEPSRRALDAAQRIARLWEPSASPDLDQRTGGSSTPRSSLPAPQITARADTHRAVRDLVVDVATIHPDALHTSPAPTGDVPAMCAWIAANADKLPELPGIDDHARALTRCARALHTLVHQPDRDRPPLGPCDRLHTGEEATGRDDEHVPRCSGTIRAVPDRDPTTGTVTYDDGTCTRCGTTATITYWMRRWGRDRAAGLVTTRTLVAELHAQGITTTEPTIRWWLHRGIIYSAGTTPTGDRLWDPAGVVAALTLHDQARRGDHRTPTRGGRP